MMSEQEKKENGEEELDLEQILQEFHTGDQREIRGSSAEELLNAALAEAGIPTENGEAASRNEPPEKPDSGDAEAAEETSAAEEKTADDSQEQPAPGDNLKLGDTRRIDGEALSSLRQEAQQPEKTPEEPAKPVEPFSEGWEPEYDQPIGEYVPPEPIVFRPRSRLKELKRKLVAGPEKRYYELAEAGVGKLQAAVFLCFVLALISAAALLLHGLGMVRPDRIRLLVFGEILGMLIAAALGVYQMMGGISSLLHGRFTTDTMLFFTFAVCCADSVLCLQQQRVPYCAAFTLEMAMSLLAEYHRRDTEMGQMDTMRKAICLDSVVKVPDYYDGRAGFLRGEGQVEDFMDSYATVSGPEKTLSRYMTVALFAAAAIGVAGGILRGYQEGIRLCAAAMLTALPASGFIALSRPAAVLERRLHRVGAVICGWQGVRGLCGPATVPVKDEDLFPAGTVKMNGVKFFGSRDPDQVVAYATALICAGGAGLSGVFNRLLDSRNGRHYDAESLHAYNGGLGGEVNGEPVLIGTHSFLREMGVEVPEGTRVHQALYVAVDGELGGVFAITYGKTRSCAAGLSALCGYRSLTPVLTCGDFMLTESFLRSKFGVNTRRIAFPDFAQRRELATREPDPDAKALAMMTDERLIGAAFAITGARALRTASVLGTAMHIAAGILGLAIVLILGTAGTGELLTAENLMLFELIWLIPALLFTEWTRNT